MRKIVCLAFLVLAGCGFTPLYGQGGAVDAQVRIDPIPDREGQMLRNQLIDRYYRLGPPANPAYALTIAPLSEGIADLDITIDSEATRQQVRLTTTMTLTDLRTGAIVIQRPLSANSSYNILGSQFTTRVSQQTARDSVISDLARQIETQMALALTR